MWWRRCFVFSGVLAAVVCGVFGAGSGFRVGWRAAGGEGEGALFSAFQGVFASVGGVLILAGGRGGWALGYHSIGFGHFPDIW